MKHTLFFLCFGAACLVTASAPDETCELKRIPQYSLDRLLQAYYKNELPVPPKQARLLRLATTATSDGEKKEYYFLAFEIRPAGKDKKLTILHGTQLLEIEPGTYGVSVWDSTRTLDRWYEPITLSCPFSYTQRFATAIQCKANGWERLAEELLARSVKGSDSHGDNSLFNWRLQKTEESAVAFLAWVTLGNELTRPQTDRNAISKKMRALFNREPLLCVEKNCNFLNALVAATGPNCAPVGSCAHLVNDLAEVHSNYLAGQYQGDPRYIRVASQGFDIVPELIAHLQDTRITRAYFGGIMNAVPHFYDVGTLCRRLLFELAQGDLERENDEENDTRHSQWWTTDDAVKQWWQRACQEGERSYLNRVVLPKRESDERPKSACVTLLASRYPYDLIKVYEQVLTSRSDVQTSEIAEAIRKSALPLDSKLSVLKRAAQHQNNDIRETALSEIWELEKNR